MIVCDSLNVSDECEPLDYYRAVLTVVLLVTSEAQCCSQSLPEQLQA